MNTERFAEVIVAKSDPNHEFFTKELGETVAVEKETGLLFVFPKSHFLEMSIPTCENGMYFIDGQKDLTTLRYVIAACHHLGEYLRDRQHAAGCI